MFTCTDACKFPIHGSRAPSILHMVCFPCLCSPCFGVAMLSSFANLPMASTTGKPVGEGHVFSYRGWLLTLSPAWKNTSNRKGTILADAVGGIFLNFKMGMSQNLGGSFVHLAGTWRCWLNPVDDTFVLIRVFIFTLSNFQTASFSRHDVFVDMAGSSEKRIPCSALSSFPSCDPSFWANVCFFLAHQQNRSSWAV